MASFFSQLGIAFIAGAFLQIFFLTEGSSAAAATLFMAGLALHGIAHILIERSFGSSQ